MSSYDKMTLAYQLYGLIIVGGIGPLQCAFIGGGLFMMHKAGQRRDRQLDVMLRGIERLLERPTQ